MFRLLLCTAFVALAALAAAPDPALACGSCGRHSSYERIEHHIRFVGFLDYRRSLDDDGRCDDSQDRRREYVFHRMSGREAYEVWHGAGHDDSWRHRHDNGCNCGCKHDDGWGESRAVAIKSRTWEGGGQHNHAWGVHASDNCENH